MSFAKFSYDETTHNQVVNHPRAHENTLRGIEYLQKQGIFTSVNMVISQANFDHLYQTGVFVSNLGVESFSTAQAIPSQAGGKSHLQQALTPEQIPEYLEALHHIREDTGMFVKLTNPVPFCSVWESRPHLRYLLETSTCTAGRTIIQIDPSGQVKPCPMINNGYGNILEEGLDVVWQRMTPWSDNAYVPETCQPCDLVERCRGGCRAEAERTCGSLAAKNPFSIKPVKLSPIQEPNHNLPIGTKMVVTRNLRARKEQADLYVLFTKDRYMVTRENVARFISAIHTKGSLTIDEKLAQDRGAIETLALAYNAGILRKAA